MTSSPGLREQSCLQARRGVLHTTRVDRRQQTPTTVTSLAPYTMCWRASNKIRRGKSQQLFANVIAALLTYNACAVQRPSFPLFY